MSDPLELPDHLRTIAREELGETPEVRRQSLEELKRRIAALPEVDRLSDVSDQNLIRFLRSRKYDIEKALQCTIELQKFNTTHAEWVENLRAEEFRVFSTFFQVLEQRGPKGQFIIVLRPNNGIKVFTPEFLAENPLAMIRCNIFFLDRLSKNVDAQVCGVVACNSFKGFTVRDNLRLSKACKVSEQIGTFRYMTILGLRLSGAFMFDQPFYMTWLWPIIRVFLSEKLRSRFHLCGSDYDAIKKVPARSVVMKGRERKRVRDKDSSDLLFAICIHATIYICRVPSSHNVPKAFPHFEESLLETGAATSTLKGQRRCCQTPPSSRRASAVPWRTAPSAG